MIVLQNNSVIKTFADADKKFTEVSQVPSPIYAWYNSCNSNGKWFTELDKK